VRTFLLGALIAWLATWLLAAVAERLGLGDASRGSEAGRKHQTRPVPPVGGLAIGFAWYATGGAGLGAGLPAWFATSGSTGLALALALAVGVTDDLRARGLSPVAKLVGQLCAGLILAAPTWTALPAAEAAAWSLAGAGGAALACNLWNTFDNADGVATGLAGTGFALLALPAAGSVLGFLPWNLFLRRAGEPRAYLGDGGSHLLGMAVLVQPAAWPLALLPAIDLLRVSALRISAGEPPWRGDRRHLAHALQRKGLGTLQVAALLIVLGLLPLLSKL